MKKTYVVSALLALLFATVAAVKADSNSDLQKTFNVSNGGKLVVSVGSGDIRIRVWDKTQVQMTVSNIGDDADRVESDQEGNTVTVRYRSHSGWWSSNRDLRFEFFVPQSFNVDLTTSGGDVEISGTLAGNAEMSTSGGDLKIDEVDGTLQGRTSGGDVVVRNVQKDATLTTSGGDIQVDRAGSKLEITTSGGEITVGTVGKDLDASTAGGDISIQKVGGELRASTASGDISVGKVGGSISVNTSGGDITLSSGNGRISANTSGGDVTISDVVGSVDVNSSGGTIKVGFTPKGDESSRIESSGGDVYLYIPSDAKVTVHAQVYGGDEESIVSDFPVTLHRRSSGFGNQNAEVTLNGGGPEIYLQTSSGSIYIQKLSSFSR